MNHELLSALYTLKKIFILGINFVHKIIVLYHKMFLYSMFITLNQLIISVIMHLQTINKQK